MKRTLKKDETWNETAQRYEFPQTPSRMQLSLWPAGQSSNAKGTIDWAGGEIDWDSEDIKNTGYYYATIGQVDVKCYDPPKDTKKTGDTENSYVYTSSNAMESDVEITSNTTVLGSLGATGLDMDLGSKSSNSSSSSGSSSSSKASSTASSSTAAASDSVPSGNGGSGGMASGNGGNSSSSSSSSTTSSASASASATGDDFNQGAPNSAPSERVTRGSLFAVLVAVVVLVTL